MVSHPEVLKRLRRFVCVRLDWEQMQKHKGRLKVPTQGNQVLLDPDGRYIAGIEPRGKRYRVDDFVALLDRISRQFPPDPSSGDDLKLRWFFFNPERQGLPKYVGPEFRSRVHRKPILEVSGAIPKWLDQPAFLRKHLRQFIWTRTSESGAPSLTVRQVAPERKTLAQLVADGESASVSRRLDVAWLEYMKVRPMVARGYIDNAHGNWLRPVLEKVHLEELEVRKKAIKGTLRPPGRGEQGTARAE